MSNEGCVHAEWSNAEVLRELLHIVAILLSKHWHGDAVTILELELSSCVSQPCDHEFSIVHVADHHYSEVVINAEDVCD